MLRPQGGKNAFDFCGGLMANTANLHCIGKNIAHVCADGFSSFAGILVNIVELAKVQILQNAQSVWLRAGVCNSLLDRFGNCRIPIISGFIWKRTQTTQTRAESPQQRVAVAFGDLLRKPFSLAQGSSKLSPFAAALALPKEILNH